MRLYISQGDFKSHNMTMYLTMWLYPTTMALYVTTVTFYVIINLTVLIELSKWDRICPSVTLYLTSSLNLTTVTLYLMMWLSHNYDFIYSLPEYCF